MLEKKEIGGGRGLMNEWDEFYEEDQKDESYEPLHFQTCRDKNCPICKKLRGKEVDD